MEDGMEWSQGEGRSLIGLKRANGKEWKREEDSEGIVKGESWCRPELQAFCRSMESYKVKLQSKKRRKKDCGRRKRKMKEA